MPEIGDSLRLCGITVLDISANGGTGPYSKRFTPAGRQPRSFRYHKRGRVARSVTSRIKGRITAVRRAVTLLYLMGDKTNNHPCQNATCPLNVDLLLSESVARVKLSASRTTCEGKITVEVYSHYERP